MNCNNCNGTLMYVGGFRCPYSLSFKNRVIHDKNIPTVTFCFVCRCCDNQIIIDWSNGKIEMMQNYGTKDAQYDVLQITLRGLGND